MSRNNQLQFIRFECGEGHITAFSYATTEVSVDYCPSCGNQEVEQIDPQYIDADLKGNTTLLSLDTGDDE